MARWVAVGILLSLLGCTSTPTTPTAPAPAYPCDRSSNDALMTAERVVANMLARAHGVARLKGLEWEVSYRHVRDPVPDAGPPRRWPGRVSFVREWTLDDSMCVHATHMCAPEDRFGPDGLYLLVDFAMEEDFKSQATHQYERIGPLLVEVIVNGPPNPGTEEARAAVLGAIEASRSEYAQICHQPR